MSVAALWLPILLSAVGVFVASSVIHMLVQWHKGDYHAFANEDAVRAAIRAGTPSPGQYVVPYCADHKLLRTPEFQQKFAEGPVAFATVRANGMPGMGPMLGGWFVYNVVVALLAACVATRGLAAGASMHSVALATGIASLLAYGGGPVQQFIWMGKPGRSAALELLDAAIYAAITACVMAWLWPR